MQNAFQINHKNNFHLATFALLAFILMAAHPAMASTGTGGSLPYKSWLTSLQDSVYGSGPCLSAGLWQRPIRRCDRSICGIAATRSITHPAAPPFA